MYFKSNFSITEEKDKKDERLHGRIDVILERVNELEAKRGMDL